MEIRSKGFTIVELLVVVVVIAILAAVTIASFNGIQSRANNAVVTSFLKEATKKLAVSYVSNDRYPDTLSSTPEGAIAVPGDMTVVYSPNNSAAPPTYTLSASLKGASYTASNTTSPGPTQLSVATFNQELYANQTLSGAPITGVVPSVNNSWGSGGPAGVGVDNFSARWSNTILVPTSGDYTFYITSDDGQRLYIDNALVIDNWVAQGPTTKQYTATLSAGQAISLKYEYYEIGGGAVAKLEWTPAGGSRGILTAT